MSESQADTSCAPLLITQYLMSEAFDNAIPLIQYSPWEGTTLSHAKLSEALQSIIEATPILRAYVDRSPNGSKLSILPYQPCQSLITHYQPKIHEKESFDSVPFADKLKHFENAIKEDFYQQVASNTNYRFRLYVCDFFPSTITLALIIDHMICDGMSASIFFRQLLRSYSNQGRHIDSGSETKAQDALEYARSLENSPRSSRQSAQNLQTRNRTCSNASGALPVKSHNSDIDYGTEYIIELNSYLKERIEKSASFYSVTRHSIILGAVSLALFEECKEPFFYLSEIVSGRNSPNIQDSIGAFLSIGLIAFTMEDKQEIASYLRRIHLEHLQSSYRSYLEPSEATFLHLAEAADSTTMIAFDYHQLSPNAIYGIGKDVDEEWIRSPVKNRTQHSEARRWPVEIRFRLNGPTWYTRLYTSDGLYTEQRNLSFLKKTISMLEKIVHSEKKDLVESLLSDETMGN